MIYDSFGYEPMIQVRNSSVLIYGQYVGDKKKCLLNLYNKDTGEKFAAYSGVMTYHAQKRIRRVVDLMLQTTSKVKIYNTYKNKYLTHRLSFITLTIPDNSERATLKFCNHNLLRPFLRYFRDKQLILTYLWKAEKQQRGALHYHITTPSYVDMNDVRHKWNSIILKNDLMCDYIKEYNNTNPPSTEVKEVFSINGLQVYIQKEVSKNFQGFEGETGKVWDCSENLKGVKYFTIPFDEGLGKMIWYYDSKGLLHQWYNEQCTVLSSTEMNFKDILNKSQRIKYNEFISDLIRFRNVKTKRVINK